MSMYPTFSCQFYLHELGIGFLRLSKHFLKGTCGRGCWPGNRLRAVHRPVRPSPNRSGGQSGTRQLSPFIITPGLARGMLENRLCAASTVSVVAEGPGARTVAKRQLLWVSCDGLASLPGKVCDWDRKNIVPTTQSPPAGSCANTDGERTMFIW